MIWKFVVIVKCILSGELIYVEIRKLCIEICLVNFVIIRKMYINLFGVNDSNVYEKGKVLKFSFYNLLKE